MTPAQINAAEAKAAHVAIEAFVNVLRKELERLGGQAGTLAEALGGTVHVHTAFYTGEEQGAIRYSFVFDDSPAAIAALRATLETQEGPPP